MCAQLTRPGSPPLQGRNTWVQTERAAHEEWARLVLSNQRAAAVLHMLVSNMESNNAVVASRGTLAQMLGVSEATIKRAIADLKAGLWIEVVQLGGKGGVNAYVVNSRVAWSTSRDRLPGALFTATVIASRSEQDSIDTAPLRTIPSLRPGELAMPTGPGAMPPVQQLLDGVPPPAIELREGEELDPVTGEIQKVLPIVPTKRAAVKKLR